MTLQQLGQVLEDMGWRASINLTTRNGFRVRLFDAKRKTYAVSHARRLDNATIEAIAELSRVNADA